MTARRTWFIVVVLVAAAGLGLAYFWFSGLLAAPSTNWKNITIAIGEDETVTITADGKPISCDQLNTYYAAMTKSQVPSLDCKRFKLRSPKH